MVRGADDVAGPAEAGPGSILVTGLPPGAATTLEVQLPGEAPQAVTVTTTPALAGPALTRIATISDLHLGLHAFGLLKTVRERGPDQALDPPSVRCARAALREAVAWGAELLVVKGDLTDQGRHDEWETAAELLAEVDVPVVVIPGNHDRSSRAEVDPVEAGARHGLHVVEGVEHLDRAGTRIVLAVTAVPGRSRGHLPTTTAEEVARTAGGGPAALVLLHHQLALRPEPPFYPPGIPRTEGDRFLDLLAAAQPRSLVSSGHTHRHRRRAHGPVTVTTVGSTKDHPGVWAGYVVHEDGLRQVVRRVADPACLRWTETTRRGAARQWARFSNGRLQDRSFVTFWQLPPVAQEQVRFAR